MVLDYWIGNFWIGKNSEDLQRGGSKRHVVWHLFGFLLIFLPILFSILIAVGTDLAAVMSLADC